MTLLLRPHQRDLADRVRAEYRSVVMMGPTGFGKTTTAASIIAVERRNR